MQLEFNSRYMIKQNVVSFIDIGYLAKVTIQKRT